MRYWELPPKSKYYEALGALADERMEETESGARCYSSSRGKYYDITYDAEANTIMANDNGSYWQGYLGYPAVAYLLLVGVLPYRPELAALLKGVAWKDINQRYRNDFDAALAEVLAPLHEEDRDALTEYVKELATAIEERSLGYEGARAKPPAGY